MNYLWIFLGGGLGSIARFAGSSFIARCFGIAFPWGTLFANIVGSFIIGFFATITGPDGRWVVAPTTRQFVMIGVCGGYTTFSSFSLETLTLLRSGEWFKAGANAVLSFAICLLAVWLGHSLAAHFNASRGI
jgi:CrcB protein